MERVAEFKGGGDKVRDSVFRNLHPGEEDSGDACAPLRADSMQVLSIAPESVRPCGLHGQNMGVPILLHGELGDLNDMKNHQRRFYRSARLRIAVKSGTKA